jgi:hypothetical protein
VGQETYSSKTKYVFQWRLAITVDDNSASICTINPGYNQNLTKIQLRFRVVDNGDGGKLDYSVMKTLLAGLVLIGGLTIGCAGIARAQIHKPGLKVGDKAPDFSLPNPDGKLISLGEYTSRGPVVVIFYRGYW